MTCWGWMAGCETNGTGWGIIGDAGLGLSDGGGFWGGVACAGAVPGGGGTGLPCVVKHWPRILKASRWFGLKASMDS